MHGPVGNARQRYTSEEANARAAEILEAIEDIKQQLANARQQARISGDRSDGDWYRSAERALREYQVEHQEMLLMQGSLRSQESAGCAPVNQRPFDIAHFLRIKASAQGMQTFPSEVPECDALMLQIARDMASIKDQLSRAQYKGKSTGVYAPSKWFANANLALKNKQAEHQALQRHAADLRRDIKRAQHDASKAIETPFSRIFMQVARANLSKEIYDSLIAEALQQQQGTQVLNPAAGGIPELH